NVLNAKQHEMEAEIIAQAGRRGAVTVATNMAGRGVDIILGGNPVDIDEARAIKEIGGLAVIGTERHESRRIDNQLRGRAGRQGDPGSSQFFVSMDDELMRIFGSDRMKGFMNRMGVPDDMPIENKMVSRSIESAQSKVEARNFDIRKHLVEYDDVMNKHRDTVYRRRNAILESDPATMHLLILEVIESEVELIVTFHTSGEPADGSRDWSIKEICSAMQAVFPIPQTDCEQAIAELKNGGEGKLEEAESRTKIIEYFTQRASEAYEQMTKSVADQSTLDQIERGLYLRAIDILWIEHLDQMSFLRDSIGLRGYGQRDPLVEYKRESYQMFQSLLASMQKEVVSNVFRVGEAQVMMNAANAAMDQQKNVLYTAPEKEMSKQSPMSGQGSADKERQATPYVSEKKDGAGHKVGRNDACP
ncbi:MAG: preprotein translocase subunit SecA, partial [Candidatus Kerfeldbacteria bacterium CG_4_9_14_3_um_filter_45_8]